MTGDLQATLWFNEYITPWDLYAHGITRVLVQQQTPFQTMAIVESGAYGKALVLDGKWQSCTGDEVLYHEGIVHPAMIAHGSPHRVLILGGGEGATLREVLRWRSVTQAVMVDIDGQVVAQCREHLPEMHQGSFDDSRAEVVIGDAVAFIARWRDRMVSGDAPPWDVIISDLSDPIESGPAYPLFTQEHFYHIREILAPQGVLALQAGPTAPAERHLHTRLANTVSTVFAAVHSYTCYAMSFGSPLGFVLAANHPLAAPDPMAVDRLLATQIEGELQVVDGVALVGMLNIPKHLRQAIAAETAVYTLASPPQPIGQGSMASPLADPYARQEL